MRSHLSLKNPLRENRIFFSRAVFASSLLLSIVGVLFIRLAFLQLYHYQHYALLSEKNRIEVVPLEAPRGRVVDRNGVVVAENRLAFSLEVIPERTQALNATLHGLTSLLNLKESEVALFNKRLKQASPFEPLSIKNHLTEQEMALFAERRYQFPGVALKANLERYYPLEYAMAHVLGYVGPPTREEQKKLNLPQARPYYRLGKEGVERSYEALLQGIGGQLQVEMNAEGRPVRYLKRISPISGKSIRLTIDSRLQLAAAQAMENKKGAVVAINPEKGEVLALASFPPFDPNAFVKGFAEETYWALQSDSRRPLFNRPLQGRYPPGSTIKPFMALAGLEFAAIRPEDTIRDPGFFSLPHASRLYRDWKKEGHGVVDLEKAIVESCDTYFYNLAQILGIDRMSTFLKQFGFGEETHIDLLQEYKGTLPSREWKWKAKQEIWFPGETIITGIGQGAFLVTPLQLATATAFLANGGEEIHPYVVTPPAHNKTAKIALSPTALAFVQKAMENTVHTAHGTAWRLGVNAHYRMAGKTGTAQVFGIPQHQNYSSKNVPLHLRDHALFISFAPIPNPKIVVVVIVENGGGGTALPIAKAVLDQYLVG
ncbi:MAG: penicillin-binding protein 2 [Gammaproteobacteria bacterium]|nr:penicillin-binding protein 2 [Gammaproteobacteria bacterium]